MRILLVEDESRVAGFIAKGLREQSYAVDIAPRWRARRCIWQPINEYDLIILDVMLPIKDGHTRLPRAAGQRCARADSDVDRARTQSTTAWKAWIAAPTTTSPSRSTSRSCWLGCGRCSGARRCFGRRWCAWPTLRLNTASHAVSRGGRSVSLTAKEYALLEFLVLNQDRVVGREQIAQHVWDENFDPFSNVIDVYIKRLRDKLDAACRAPPDPHAARRGLHSDARPGVGDE